MLEDKVERYGDCCRLCASREHLMLVLDAHGYNNMRKLISKHLNVMISDEDSLPTQVCVDCGDTIEMFHNYFEECKKVQEWLAKSVLNGAGTCSNYVKQEFATDDYGENSKNEIKQEEFESRSELPEINVADDTYSDSNSSIIPLLMLSNSEGTKKKRKSKSDEKDHLVEIKSDIEGKLPKINHEEGTYSDSDSSIIPLLMISNRQTTKKKIKRKSDEKYQMVGIKRDISDVNIGDYVKTVINENNFAMDYVSATNNGKQKLQSEVKLETITKKISKKNKITAKKIINFKCNLCRKDCLSWYRLKKHYTQMHKSQPVVYCRLCNIPIHSKSVMYKHISDHKHPSVFMCDTCPKITKSAIAMRNHKMRHIPKSERVYNCESCPKIFKTNELLKSHLLSHIPIEQRKKYPCTVCDMKFTTKSAAAGHKRVVHDKIKPYVCDLCGYTCATGHELRQHRAIHSEEKLFVCNICSKSFKTDSNLRTHIDIHENTSYHCSVCNKVLNTRRTFRKHLLVHETQRKHVCSFCKATFKRRQTLMVHLNSHTGDKPIACQWCSEKFMYAASYRTHKQRRHPDKLMQTNPAIP